MDTNPYKTLETKTVLENSWITIREDSVVYPGGDKGTYPVIETQDSAIVLAVDQKGEIAFIHAFRYPNNAWVWRLPGGIGSAQEPIQVGMRKLAEQTGFVASEYHLIGAVRLHSLLTEKMHVVVLRELTQTDENRQAEIGIDATKFQSLDAAELAINSGEIDDSQSITALYMYKCWLNNQ